jgi:hypothetical protein
MLASHSPNQSTNAPTETASIEFGASNGGTRSRDYCDLAVALFDAILNGITLVTSTRGSVSIAKKISQGGNSQPSTEGHRPLKII